MFYASATSIDPLADRRKMQFAGKTCGLVLACALVVLLALMTSSAAAAGTYVVNSCSSVANTPLSSQAWTLHLPDPVPAELSATPDCSGGALVVAINNPAAPTDASGYFSFDAPPNTSISDYKLWRSLQVVAAPDEESTLRYRAFVRERVSPTVSSDYGCISLIGGPCLSLGSIADPFNLSDLGTQVTKQGAQNLSSVELRVGCVVDTTCGAYDGPAARARLFRSQVTLADTSVPTIEAPTGSLLGPGPASGSTAGLVIHATDLGGGIASATAAIDGAKPGTWSAGTDALSCNAPFTAAVPCPLAADPVFSFDVKALATGTHWVAGAVVDAAGNSISFGPIYFTVDNSAPPSQPPIVVAQGATNGTPAVTTPILTMKADSLVRPRGTKTAATGLLTTQDGRPIARAALRVHSVQLATDQLEEQDLPDVETAPDGTFTIPVDSDGAQLLRVEFTPSPGSAVTASASVSVRTETAVSLKTSKKKLKRGRKVTLSGALLGAGRSAAGTTATIQAIVRGKWRPVGSATIGSAGQFKWTYKFVALHRPTLFSFRAVVVRTPGWPWPTTRSSRIHVKVTL
jgi:hypothetical protein